MQSLKKLEDFRKENQNEITIVEMIGLVGGSNGEVKDLTFKDTATMTEWNCQDIDRVMLWKGKPCSEPFRIYEEK
ncbi:MAG: hypothetical protein ACOVLC_12065 [Flavobacterium sp.]